MNNKTTKIILLLFAVLSTARSQQVPTDNVVAYYPFLGDAKDLANSKDGQVSGATLTNNCLGEPNSAYYFNSVLKNLIYLPTDLLPGNTAFAVCFWFRSKGDRPVQDIYYAQQIIDFRGQFNFNVCYFESNHPAYQNTVAFNIANSSANLSCVAPNGSVHYNEWKHMVANYGDNTMELYFNGQLVASQTQSPPGPVSGYNNAIGKDYNIGQDRLWLYAVVDEVLIYSRRLTAAEIQTISGRYFSPELCTRGFDYTFLYDGNGNRLNRGLIVLKSALAIGVNADSSEMAQTLKDDAFGENAGDDDVRIYPNPTRGELKVDIQGEDNEKKVTINLYTLSGKLLISKSPAEQSNILDLSVYSQGPYILKITVGDKTKEWKIIKE